MLVAFDQRWFSIEFTIQTKGTQKQQTLKKWSSIASNSQNTLTHLIWTHIIPNVCCWSLSLSTSVESTLFQIIEYFSPRSMEAPAKLLLPPVKVYANFPVVLLCPIPAVMCMYYVLNVFEWRGPRSRSIFPSPHSNFSHPSIVCTRFKESTEKKDNNNAEKNSNYKNVLGMAKLARKLFQYYASWARNILFDSLTYHSVYSLKSGSIPRAKFFSVPSFLMCRNLEYI